MAFTATLDVTDPQEAALQKLIDKQFEDEDPGSRPTPAQYVDARISELVNRLRDEYLALRRQEIFAALRVADNAQLAAVESTLGLP
jgi:hypothetical protein